MRGRGLATGRRAADLEHDHRLAGVAGDLQRADELAGIADALGVGRSRQDNKEGYAKKRRELLEK